MDQVIETVHLHRDRYGGLHACWHKCQNLFTSWQFWLGTALNQTLWFPFEHGLWEKVPPFSYITHWVGL